MTHRERILKAIKGEMPDRIPFAPRLDLWYSANQRAGTLPEKYKNMTADQIARVQGWALRSFIVALIIFGPKRLPEIGRWGRMLSSLNFGKVHKR